MGNLFLREKENWLAWSIWGLLGAFVTLYVAMSTNAAPFIAVQPSVYWYYLLGGCNNLNDLILDAH